MTVSSNIPTNHTKGAVLVTAPGDGDEGVHVALHETHGLDIRIRLLQRQLHVRTALVRTHSCRHQVRKCPVIGVSSVD